MVVADRRDLCGRNRQPRPVAAGKLAVVCGGNAWSLSALQRDEIYLMTDSLVVRSMV